MVLHMKPAGDSLFNAEWDEQDNFYYYTLFCFSLQHHLPQSPPSPPPAPPSLKGKLVNFHTGYPVKVWECLPLVQWL